MVQDIPPQSRQDLILSLGTHQTKRRLSPIEVARLIDVVLKTGRSFADIADLVRFGSTSTLREIHRLLAISPDIQYMIGWGKPTPSTLPMKSASQVGRLNIYQEQIATAEAILLNGLTSEESRQVVERKLHSDDSIEACIQSVLRLRPTIDRRYLFVGAITSDDLCNHLEKIDQSERNKLFLEAINACFGTWPEWSGNLGTSRFTVVGGAQLAEAINKSLIDLEQEITACLEAAVKLP